MITLLASIAGFLTSIIPDIFKIFIDRNDKRHELEIMDRQIKMQQQNISQHLEEIRLSATSSEMKALYSTYKSGNFLIDALNASVRPILAYSFFGLYAAVKYLQFKMLASLNDYALMISSLWSVDDQAIFAGIISFYFGQRALAKKRYKK